LTAWRMPRSVEKLYCETTDCDFVAAFVRFDIVFGKAGYFLDSVFFGFIHMDSNGPERHQFRQPRDVVTENVPTHVIGVIMRDERSPRG